MGGIMECNDIDRISRNGHSRKFEDEVRSVLNDIDLGIDRPSRFLHYTAYSTVDFNIGGDFFRIPCKSRTVYCRKVHDFWDDKYEITYKTSLSIYGRKSKYEFMRSVTVDFPEIIPVELTEEVRSELRCIIREHIQTIGGCA